jgi:ABC-type Fe3+-hydroxamate transport system substrate-binding protein/adenosylcobinamide amidohydrolase
MLRRPTRGALPSPTLALLTGIALVTLLPGAPHAAKPTVWIRDSAGNQVPVPVRPARIVSLVPSVTETLFAIGAGASVVGVTWHDQSPAGVHSKIAVGGFGAPSPEAIAALKPDLIVVSRLHAPLRPALQATGAALLELDDTTFDAFDRRTRMLGRLTGRRGQAADLIAGMRGRLVTLAQKVARIPEDERKRVARLMYLDGAMAPGDDSFQVELIRAAGGIPPAWGLDGQVVSPSPEAWRAFDPQVIYACGGDPGLLERMRADPLFRELSAVKDGAVFDFPCALTCRTSVHFATFAEWLAATVYPERLAGPDTRLRPDARLRRRELPLPLGEGFAARIVTSRIDDFEHSSLVLELPRPMIVVSSLEGRRTGVRTVINHGLPPPHWHALHADGPEAMSRRVCGVLGIPADSASVLHTGADASLAVVRSERHGDLTVLALVTAGVASNAQRAGTDEGPWLEPGTINIVLITSRRLSERAMIRAIITATEAKTAALQDLDIRSSFRPGFQATGTGTDNIAVVEGDGAPADNAGGHCKLGELIGRAVRSAVTEAVARQNHLAPGRSVFARLAERGLGLDVLAERYLEPGSGDPRRAAIRLERLLLDPGVAGLVATALAAADAERGGLIADSSALGTAARTAVARAAGLPRVEPLDAVPDGELPAALEQVIEVLLGAAAAAGGDLPPSLAGAGTCPAPKP